ncbi:MAG: cytochrome c3 family protein [Anaerolineae bacterium]
MKHGLVLLVLAVAMVLALMAGVFVLVAQAGPNAQPPLPHTLEGREYCLACHAPESFKPVPADHVGRTVESCTECHTTPEAVTPMPIGNEACLQCHQNLDLSMTLSSGENLPLYIDAEAFSQSVHGASHVMCIDCHRFMEYPHPELEAESRREFSLVAYEACRRCHSDKYEQTLDSVHAEILRTQSWLAPVCTDCHGAHYVVDPHQPRTRVSQTCAQCHRPIYDNYKDSVHGKALIEEANPDVPVCTDCHGVHSIQDPRTAVFHVESPELCARCHTDENLMAKYNLSTRVYKTYKEEFHGMTVEFYRTYYPTIWCYKAVCTDCHGIHDIKKTHDPTSSVHPDNLLNTCRKCHPDAGPKFTAAWTGHYEPGKDRAAMVYYVQLFYRTLIPLIMAGILGYIVLDAVRLVLNRRRRREIR